MRLALTFLLIATLAAPAGAAVGAVDVDDSGRGAYVSDGTALVTVDADATSGEPIDFGARLALDVSDTGRLAVVAPIDATTLGVGVGTTSAPPRELVPFATATDPIDAGYRVAIGRDGRLLVAWSERAEDLSSRVVAARLAPGEDAPRLTELASYDVATGGYPPSYSVVAIALDAGARPAVAYEQSGPTGSNAYVQRAAEPDGGFGPRWTGISAARYTREPLTLLEGTGFTSLFAYGISTRPGLDAVFAQRLSPEGKESRPVTIARLSRPRRWSAAVGANGSGVIAWSGQKQLRVRTRTENGKWDAKAQTLARSIDGERPAVTVSKLGHKLLAFPRGGGIVTSTARAGQPFTKLQELAGTNGCDRVSLAGAASGRALAVMRCGDVTRLAALRTG